MPELPEVETIVRELKAEVLDRTFLDTWTDAEKLIKNISFEEFRKTIKNKKIIDVRRRGKNILIDLSFNYVLLVHQKITGHLLLGSFVFMDNKWVPKEKGLLSEDPMNRFLHVVFVLDDNRQLALSDARKFAKIELWQREALEKSKEYMKLGPEPLDKDFTFDRFKQLFIKKKGKIKQVLMDQSFIVGIGNIYASEILFSAGIHPEEEIKNLGEKDLKSIYSSMVKTLNKSIELKGDSFSDFRTISGEKGGFQSIVNVYQREGQACFKCKGKIKRIIQGGRSSFYCPKCQPKK